MSSDKKPRRRRILSSLLLVLLGVGTVPLLGTAYDLVSRSKASLEFNQKLVQNDKARSMARQVASYVQSLRSQVHLIAQTLELESGSFPQRVERIRTMNLLTRYVGEESPFVLLTVADASGDAASYGLPLQEEGLKRRLKLGFDSGMEGKGMVSHPMFSTVLQEPVIVISEPVGFTEGKPAQGVVVAVGSLVPLSSWAAQMSQGGLWDVYVVDSRGHLIAHREKEHLVNDPDVSKIEIVHQFLDRKSVV